MSDFAQKRATLIKHLLSALDLANELRDGDTMHLIERALAQADKAVEPAPPAQPESD